MELTLHLRCNVTMHVAAARSQNRTVLSQLPEASSSWPCGAGAERYCLHWAGMAGQWRAHRRRR